MVNYVDAKDFRDFQCNQEKLINILNHNMTVMKIDVSWLKKLNGWQIGILGGILIAVICSVFL